jgi:hypothetical protein
MIFIIVFYIYRLVSSIYIPVLQKFEELNKTVVPLREVSKNISRKRKDYIP